ncbi:MAG: gadC [Gammaproteobacteria bacterium]|nr:gadC [Gammaproteobacteria bacterium]
MAIKINKNIGTFALTMFITGAIDTLRNLPVTALYGYQLVIYLSLAAMFFLIPAALVSAELSASFVKKSGVFYWVQEAFGSKMGFFAAWLQWINTLVWFPTILSFITTTALYAIDPLLAKNKFILIANIIITFWLLTFVNFRGIKLSVKFSAFCTVIGIIIPIFTLIILSLFCLIKGYPNQLHLQTLTLSTSVKSGENWTVLTGIIAAFVGLELASVHIQNVIDPQKTFPKALLFSVFLIIFTMLSGSLAIAILLPKSHISLVAGVIQSFSKIFNFYHLPYLVSLFSCAVVAGALGGMLSWIISPLKGLLCASELGYFPSYLVRQNKYGVPTRFLILQASIVSVICLVYIFMPSINSSYWILTVLSTQLYMTMYAILFLAAIYLKYKYKYNNNIFSIPGGAKGTCIVASCGLVGCCITFIVGFILPYKIHMDSFKYLQLCIAGLVILILPVALFYMYQSITAKK